MNNFSTMWDFPIMDHVTLEYANRIHPLMQKRVERLLDALKKTQTLSESYCLAVPWSSAAAARAILICI